MFPLEDTIFVIDDSMGVRALVRRQLEGLGYKNIIDAENGKDALGKIEAHYASKKTVGLIICDWNMPEMNGIELLLRLKNNPDLKSIPFLMVTSESETENVVKAIVLGVSDFIVKPFDEALMSEKLKAIWSRFAKDKA